MRTNGASAADDEAERLGSSEHVGAITTRLGHGLAELATDIRALVEAAVPALGDDEGELRRLADNVQHEIDGALALASGPADSDAGKAAMEYARRLAERGLSPLVLIRAYRQGQRRFVRRVVAELLERDHAGEDETRATLDTIDRVDEYVDAVVEQLIKAYAEARKEWLDPAAIRAARVRSVLTDATLTPERAQERLAAYRVRQHHLGAELWSPPGALDGDGGARLRRFALTLAKQLGTAEPPLFVPVDGASACVWLALGERAQVDLAELEPTFAAFEGVYAAFGEVGSGLPGFRRTHQQAVAAAAVARVNVPPLQRLTPFAAVAPIAAMAADLESARAWVAETLGALATDDARHALFRESARVFFATGGSYAATAERLGVHRNTAQYRIRTAQEMRGRSFREGRLDVELALLAARWFGRAVLRPAGGLERVG